MSEAASTVETAAAKKTGAKKRVSYYYDPDIGNFYYGQVRAHTHTFNLEAAPLFRPAELRRRCAGPPHEAAPDPGRAPPHRGMWRPAYVARSRSSALCRPLVAARQSHPLKRGRSRSPGQAYDMYKKMEVLRPTASTAQEMTKFHSNDYVNFMQNVRLPRNGPPNCLDSPFPPSPHDLATSRAGHPGQLPRREVRRDAQAVQRRGGLPCLRRPLQVRGARRTDSSARSVERAVCTTPKSRRHLDSATAMTLSWPSLNC